MERTVILLVAFLAASFSGAAVYCFTKEKPDPGAAVIYTATAVFLALVAIMTAIELQGTSMVFHC